jgi:hypothetical protein
LVIPGVALYLNRSALRFSALPENPRNNEQAEERKDLVLQQGSAAKNIGFGAHETKKNGTPGVLTIMCNVSPLSTMHRCT